MRKRLLVFVNIAVLHATLFTLAFPATVLGVCSKKYGTALNTPSANSYGGGQYITLKTLHADDWAAGGFASQVIWVGTDNKADLIDAWVETGVTHGWQGQDQYVFYGAHGTVGGAYAEHKFTHLPIVGTSAWVRAYRTNNQHLPFRGHPPKQHRIVDLEPAQPVHEDVSRRAGSDLPNEPGQSDFRGPEQVATRV